MDLTRFTGSGPAAAVPPERPGLGRRSPEWSPPGWAPPSSPPDPSDPGGSGPAGSLVLGMTPSFDSFPADPRHAIFQRLLRERTVMIGSELDDEVAAQVTGALMVLAAESDDDVRLYLNSSGGAVSAALAVLDTMQYVRCDIATVAMGLAGSMGQVLLSAGTPGKRYALPHARIMLHQPAVSMTGSASDVRIAAEQIQAVKRQLAVLNAEHTGQSVEQIEADSERDRWFTATEAVEYGLVDRVLTQTELNALP